MRAAGLLPSLLLAGAAVAQDDPGRYAMLADGAGGLWVLDGAGGRVARCIEDGAARPRVVDVVGGMATPRDPGGVGREPICTDWVAFAAAEPRLRPRVVSAGPMP
jgi:hypothetical protein